MNESQWEETRLALRRLSTLLPPSTQPTQASINGLSLTPEQETEGWRRWMAVMIRRGWKYGDDGNLHRNGIAGMKITRPAQGFIGPWRAPWDPQYNPRVDAPAAIRGATFISPNRYRYGAQLLDANAGQRDEARECPVCGCMPGDTYRMTRRQHLNPFAPAWAGVFEPCQCRSQWQVGVSASDAALVLRVSPGR